MGVSVRFVDRFEQLAPWHSLAFIGSKNALLSDVALQLLPHQLSKAVWRSLARSASPEGFGSKLQVPFVEDVALYRVFMLVLPARSTISRHNHPACPHAITDMLLTLGETGSRLGVVFLAEDAEDAPAVSNAISRSFPLLSYRSSSGRATTLGEVLATVVNASGAALPDAREVVRRAGILEEGIRATQRLVDTPPNQLTVGALVQECYNVGKAVNAEVRAIRGEQLRRYGLNCIAAVGAASAEVSGEPAMVVLSRRRISAKPGEPAAAGNAAAAAPTEHSSSNGHHSGRSVVLVGKGIVFDTGGLSLKPRDAMCEMKMDMGGSAACLLAFQCAIRAGFPGELHCVMCIAENGVGPRALRPDDVIRAYSGRSIEINNPDAEGRLVLADGVAYAAKDLRADVIVTVATLTGAQMVATGLRHAAVISNDEELQRVLIECGRRSGDLTWPLPYCPEFYQAEFTSKVADMKNSVKNRANAQTSCAAQFIASHLPPTFAGSWAHVDMAGPAMRDGRATGYGVALLVELLRNI